MPQAIHPATTLCSHTMPHHPNTSAEALAKFVGLLFVTMVIVHVFHYHVDVGGATKSAAIHIQMLHYRKLRPINLEVASHDLDPPILVPC